MRGTLESAHEARWFWWSVGLAALVQLALFATATGPGLAGTGDSGYYLHAAGTLRTAGHLLNPDGSAYRYWPPLYPALLALGGSLGAARLLQGSCLVISLLAWSQLGRSLLPRAVAVVLPWALALSTPWLLVSKFVWAETVFLALFAGYAGALFRWLRIRRAGWGALATGLGVLLPLQRTAGFFLLAGVALGLLPEWRKLLPKQRLLLVAHFAISVVGGILWHFYALLVAAPSVYRLNRGWAQFFDSAADYGFLVGRWLLPVPAAWRPEVPVLWALGLLGLLAWLWPRPPRALEVAPGFGPVSPWLAAFPRVVWMSVFVFILLMLISTTFTRSASGLYDSERYASVLYGPVLLLALRRLGGALAAKNSAPRRWPQLLLLGIMGIFVAYAAGRSGSNALSLRKLPVLMWPAANK
ncbi:hypothetical protein [Hymenobacter terricola]|uniref:hypothetical protein n=1 Tax=Hymenobacter terricola TaxID=2819236 RepID=UPI001B318207|nr:hypothetical protein [Hymenobacter terricola]